MTMRKTTSLAIFALMWMMGTVAFAEEHNYVNGICYDDNCTAPYEEPQLDTDGYYMLCNAGNVEWFRVQVNNNLININGKLMNDIDFENKENLHYPIGDAAGHKYNGIFNGQGHRIMNLYMNYPDTEKIGFFGWLRGNGQNTEIRNLIMDKSCTIIGKHRVGAVAGCCQNNATGVQIILENIINEAHVIATTGTDVGGLIGGRDGNSPVFVIRNYINTGTIEAQPYENDGTQCYAGAVSGWYGDNGSNLNENIINIGQIIGMPADGRAIGRLSGTTRNIVDLSGGEGITQGIIDGLTAEDITSGKLAYYINSNSQCGTGFYQTLEGDDKDEYPVPFSTSKQVYLQGELNCDGSAKEGGTYTNEVVDPVLPPHEYEEGDYHCINCGAINTNFCDTVDGFYQLKSVNDVLWFAELTKQDGYQSVNAKLTCDLDFSGVEFTGIADRNHGFKGIFDGGYHTISNMDMNARVEEDWVGFINFLNGGATVKNLRGDETCVIVAHGNAGFIGGSTAAGDIHLENLGFEGDVTCTKSGAGGVLGCNTGSQAIIYMTNCYSTGFISGSEVMENGALSAWLGGDGAVITNCWSSATVSGVQNDEKYLARFNSATFTNCYSTNGTPLQCTVIDYEEVENGALCYKLNGKQTDIVWFQNIDNGTKDTYPTFLPGHSQVYANATMSCDGSFDAEEATYSNTQSSEIPAHKFVDGFCTVCNTEDADYPFVKVFANADHDITTGYTSINSNDGSKLAINNSVAEHWNMKNFNTYQPITGLKKGVYKLRVQGLQRVQAWGDAEDNAYASGELNPDMVPLYHSSQYYAELNGKMVANLFKDIAEDRQEENVGETENYNEGTNAYVPNSLAACHKYFAKGLYWNTPLYFYVENETDTVNVGVQNGMYIYGNWTVWDTWRLEYVGDDATSYELIRKQQEGNIQDLSTLDGNATLEEAYKQAQENLSTAQGVQAILDAADVLSRTPLQIRQSHLAYIAYDEAIKTIRTDRGSRDDLYGPATDLLDKYLEDDEEASEQLPNGTYQNIIDARTLTDEQLDAEIIFAQELFNNAIMNSISEGSDISNVIVNPAFDQDGSFAGWTQTHTQLTDAGSNFSSNTGFTDIYPVAGTWNTSFDVYQDIESELPNGIYELEAPAFYRPGGNGMGDLDGNDYIPADLYINDYYTPIMNIYKGQVLYEDAINGVNCRYDASNDPEAPHNGETTSAQDFDTGTGYVPEQRQAVSFAFAGGRYINKVYGVVTDGKLRLGIRNTGKPVYDSGMTMWGKFKLTYRGTSDETINNMVANFNARLSVLEYARVEQLEPEVKFSAAHIDNIKTYLAEVEAATDTESKLAAIKKVNDEFNTINDSYDTYEQLNTLATYCNTKAEEYMAKASESEDEEEIEKYNTLCENFYSAADIILAHRTDGDLTDEEVKAYRENILNDASLGGGYYVQGDLLDAEGNKLEYSTISTYYPMVKQADGTYTCTFKVQDRTNLANGNARAGIYVTRMDERLECTMSSRRFITPARNTHKMVVSENTSYNDFQANGGEYKMTYNPADSTVVFELIGEYPWSNNVYVVGSILDQSGNTHRWVNDEMAPLAHTGNGVYEGTVKFYRDEKENLYPNFTIFSCRSNTGAVPYSTVARSSWTEGRYGNSTNKLILQDGVARDSLTRGQDRKWYMEWAETDTTITVQEYKITFDMNNETVTTVRIPASSGIKGDLNGDKIVDGSDIVVLVNMVINGEHTDAADLTGDGIVDGSDIAKLVNTVVSTTGDVKAYLRKMRQLWKTFE